MVVHFHKLLGRLRHGAVRRLLIALALCLFTSLLAPAQDTAPSVDAPATTEQHPQPEAGKSDDPLTTMFPRAEWDRWWLSGQANFISQWHPSFPSPYQGKNSLTPEAQDASSRVLTLFTGWRPTGATEFLCDVQETGGHGLAEALGVAGFPNLDVVRNPTLSKAPYVARLMWHQIIPLGGQKVIAERNPLSLFRELPERRLEVRFGKFSLVDFFDLNTYGTDSNLQFMNWAVDNNAAYDYAADTRGFTFGALFEYHDRNYALRFAEGLMPKVANGIHLDADLARAHAENLEFELHGRVLGKQPGILRLLSYVNHANMGDYRQQVDAWLANPTTPAPLITAHPLQTTIKYGFGVNTEQPLTGWLGIFGRWGWNEGQHESFAYTEVDQTWQVGVGGNGSRWRRPSDRLGLVFVTNGINHEHARYLGYGGLGFLLGDGKLNYGRENIIETFYTLHAWRGVFPSFGLQYIVNPGYNRDRGPVVVPSLRLHIDL
ncbi:MAG TPA: carbohydrate porin [Candidatus Limnocylindrales bacterium]|nr:carbohydrate porin [Candidatus Limnocylindrales bacterium]